MFFIPHFYFLWSLFLLNVLLNSPKTSKTPLFFFICAINNVWLEISHSLIQYDPFLLKENKAPTKKNKPPRAKYMFSFYSICLPKITEF